MTATKKEMSKVLNDLLDTDIEWERLLKDDLKKVVEIFSEPEELYSKLKGEGGERGLKVNIEGVRNATKQLLEGWEGPIVSNLREVTNSLKKFKQDVIEELQSKGEE